MKAEGRDRLHVAGGGAAIARGDRSRPARATGTQSFCTLPRLSTASAWQRQRPPPGGSMCRTSAPWSASICAASGPATYWPKSTTRKPWSGSRSSASSIADSTPHFGGPTSPSFSTTSASSPQPSSPSPSRDAKTIAPRFVSRDLRQPSGPNHVTGAAFGRDSPLSKGVNPDATTPHY